MLAIAIITVLLLAFGFVCVWALESRCRLIMTPLLVVGAYMAIRILPAMIYAGSDAVLGSWLPFGVAVCAGIAFLTAYALVNHHVSLGAPVRPRRLQKLAGTDGAALATLVILMALISALGVYLYGGIPSGTVALIGLVAGDDFGSIAAAMADSRTALTKGHYFGAQDRGQGLVRDLTAYAWPFLVLISAYCFSVSRRRGFALLAVAGFIASFVFIAGDGTRAPFLNTVVIYAIGASLMRPLRVRHLAAVVAVVLLLGILVSVYSQKAIRFVDAESPVMAALESVGERILLGNAINDALAIDLIDRGKIGHRDGSLHLRDLQATIPGVAAERPFSYELYLYFSNDRGTTYLTGTYLTKPYVDFGIAGVIVAYFLIGMTACAIFRLLLQLPNNPVTLAVTSVAIHALAQMVLSRGVITLGPSAIVLALCMALFAVSWLIAQSIFATVNGAEDFIIEHPEPQ